jgi:hypothetical protein
MGFSGFGVSTPSVSSLGKPFDFPFSGGSRTGTPINGNTTNSPYVLLETAAGTAGVIRQMHVAMGGATTEDCWAKSSLQVYYDGSDTASINVPLGDLVAMGVATGTSGTGPTFDTNWFSVVDSNYASQQHAVVLRYPIPYTNGIKVQIADTSAGAATTYYGSLAYQNALPDCWNRGYKLKASRVTGTLAAMAAGSGTITTVGTAAVFSTAQAGLAVGDIVSDGEGSYLREIVATTNTTHFTLDAGFPVNLTASAWRKGRNLEWLNIAAGGSGILVANIATFTPDASDAAYLETAPHLHIDGSVSANYEWDGCEDYFGSAYYFDVATGPYGDWAGIGFRNNTTKVYSAYHIHEMDPVFFTDGIRGHWANSFYGAGTTADVDAIWTALYYEKG